MNGPKENRLLVLAVMLSAAASVAGWLAVPAPAAGSWPVRVAAACAVLALAGASVGLVACRLRASRRAVERHIEALCALESHQFREAAVDQLPPLPSGSVWKTLADRIRETLAEQGDRVQGLEHAKTAIEIRCRRALAESERVRSILACMSEPIIAIDDFDELLMANPAAEALFRLGDGEPDQRALDQLVHCQKLVDLLTDACHRSAGHRSDEIEIVDPHGQSQWYRVSASKLGAPACEGEAAGHGAVAVLRDIGVQKALQKRNAEFVSAVSHEMKTPLAGIKAYVELLADGDAEDDETREEFLEVINGQADRLQRLVDNMLNLARIEAGVVNVQKRNHSLNEILEEALHVVQPAAEAKKLALTAELSSLYLGVLADRDMLLQSAINLLSNAIKYTPEGGRVTLRSRAADPDVAFEVEDTGVGLSEEDCRRVFEKFYRVNKDKTMASGTGLGLPLAKHIVEDVHGGRLTVESRPGAGSTFRATLPAAAQMT